MIVRAKSTALYDIPANLKYSGWSEESILHITMGTDYVVHAISVFEGWACLQIVDDLDGISWLPSCVFEIVNTEIPTDWKCNILEHNIVIMAPDYISNNYDAYERMVEHDANQVSEFRRRCKKQQDEQ